MASPSVIVTKDGQTVTLTSPSYVQTLGRIKRIKHQLHLDDVVDQNIIIRKDLPSSLLRRASREVTGGPDKFHRSNCYTFAGSTGSVTLSMHSPVNISAVRLIFYTSENTDNCDTENSSNLDKLEYISNVISDNAPEKFQLTGWTLDPIPTSFGQNKAQGVDLGMYTYVRPKSQFEEMQTFFINHVHDLKRSMLLFRAVTVSVLSNHGAPFTTICRVKVLGSIQTKQ